GCEGVEARGLSGVRPIDRRPERLETGRKHMNVLIVVAIVAVVVLFILTRAIKVVREYQRIVLFRLGRMTGLRGPGLVLIFPGIDRAVWVDLREQYLEIPKQTAITEDNAAINIDFIIFYKVDRKSTRLNSSHQIISYAVFCLTK